MPELGESLSPRELEVLECVVGGASNKEIASSLSISHNTVKVHLRNIFTKMGAASRTEATTLAIQQGLIEVPGTAVSPTSPTTNGNEAATTRAEAEANQPVAVESAAQPATTAGNSSTTWLLAMALFIAVAVATLLLWPQNRAADSPATVAATALPFAEEELGDNWVASRPMTSAGSKLAVAAVGPEIYTIGGEVENGVTATARVFDTRDRVWREVATKQTAVSEAGAAVLFGEIFVVGGRLANGGITDRVEAYSPTNDEWRDIAPLPQPIAGGLALSDAQFLYLLGGWDGESSLNTAYRYDWNEDSWTTLPPLPQATAYATGAFIIGQLYIIGGTNNGTELPNCQKFDPINESWDSCAPMSLPRAGASAALLLNQLYIIGGGLDADAPVRFGEVYDATQDAWRVINLPPGMNRETWLYPGVTAVETRLYVFGGQSATGENFADTLVYTPFIYFFPAASASGNSP